MGDDCRGGGGGRLREGGGGGPPLREGGGGGPEHTQAIHHKKKKHKVIIKTYLYKHSYTLTSYVQYLDFKQTLCAINSHHIT